MRFLFYQNVNNDVLSVSITVNIIEEQNLRYFPK